MVAVEGVVNPIYQGVGGGRRAVCLCVLYSCLLGLVSVMRKPRVCVCVYVCEEANGAVRICMCVCV